jgi:hypothetical protein
MVLRAKSGNYAAVEGLNSALKSGTTDVPSTQQQSRSITSPSGRTMPIRAVYLTQVCPALKLATIKVK